MPKMPDLKPEQVQIFKDTIKRSMRYPHEQQQVRWFQGYVAAREEGVEHRDALDVADEFMEELRTQTVTGSIEELRQSQRK